MLHVDVPLGLVLVFGAGVGSSGVESIGGWLADSAGLGFVFWAGLGWREVGWRFAVNLCGSPCGPSSGLGWKLCELAPRSWRSACECVCLCVCVFAFKAPEGQLMSEPNVAAKPTADDVVAEPEADAVAVEDSSTID
jgi:hypothetical protein